MPTQLKKDLAKKAVNFGSKDEKNKEDSKQSIKAAETDKTQIKAPKASKKKSSVDSRQKTMERLGLTDKAIKKRKAMSVSIPESTYLRLKEISKEMGVPVNRIILALIEDFIKSV